MTTVAGIFNCFENRLARFLDATTSSSQSMSSSAAKLAWAFRAENTEAITHLGIAYQSRTGTPPTYRISLQSIDPTTGNPDGTVLGGGTPASVTFTPPADTTWNTTFQWFQLDNSYTPTLGQLLAVVVEYSSGTVNASNLSSIFYGSNSSADQNFPFPFTNSTGTWAKQLAVPMFGVRTANTRYGNPYASAAQSTRTAANDRMCLKFNLPSSWGISSFVPSAIMVRGIAANGSNRAPTIGIWNAAGTALITQTIDSEQIAGISSGSRYIKVILPGSRPTLNAATDYYFGWQVNTSSENPSVNTLTLTDANDRLAFEGGTNICYSIWNGSAWVDINTSIPLIGFEVSDVTYSGGGGGGVPLIGKGLVF